MYAPFTLIFKNFDVERIREKRKKKKKEEK